METTNEIMKAVMHDSIKRGTVELCKCLKYANIKNMEAFIKENYKKLEIQLREDDIPLVYLDFNKDKLLVQGYRYVIYNKNTVTYSAIQEYACLKDSYTTRHGSYFTYPVFIGNIEELGGDVDNLISHFVYTCNTPVIALEKVNTRINRHFSPF